jgi:beta-N-acetylhexosaminidase
MLEQILSLSIEKKIGQLFFIGIPGAELDDFSRKLLNEISPGGICLFARNIREATQTRRLLDQIRENLSIAPFLSVDQEGGLVDRLRRIIEPMPSANSLRSSNDVGKLAEIAGEALRILGFNMNFAPVVDVIDDKRSKTGNGLYSRAFGNSKEKAAEFARVYLETLDNVGCLGCLKHFPGLGASEVDSHEELPQVNISEEELFDIDLFPYREIFKTQKAFSVMIAHASFPNSVLQEKDSNGNFLPSSLSYNFVAKLLREELNFSGIAITDDLEMGAILKNYGIGEACKMALQAGCDMLAICADAGNIRKGFEAILSAVLSNEISTDRIDESLVRIAEAKNLLNLPLPFDENRLCELSGKIAELKENINL